MKKHKISINLEEYDSIEVFSKKEQTVIQAALDAMKKAYAKYSHFQVGAAVLLDNGEIITGNNQENAAFPSGLCAERIALFYANAKYPDVPVSLLVVVAGQQNKITLSPATPCGACRQVMLETEFRFKKPIKIIMVGKDKIFVLHSVKELLPVSFDPNLLHE